MALDHVDALSETRIGGRDLCLTNLLNANRNLSTVKSVTTSRYIALVVAHVNRQTYTFISVLEWCTYIAPVKSMPVKRGQTPRAKAWRVRGSIGFPIRLRQVVK